jgi:broad specificity phosphatase PhoE
MKKIYFVRHGQSESNVANVHGHAEHPLTEVGRQQAEFVAERCARLPVETFISSTMTRARQTAAAISKKIGLEPQYSDLFTEARGPTAFQGKPKDSAELVAGQLDITEHFGVPGYHFADEENFDDLNERARRALEYLAGQEAENILVVTHGYFMRILIARVVFGDNLTAREGKEFIRTFHMENTGLSVFGYDTKQENPWWLWVWNDHEHLG